MFATDIGRRAHDILNGVSETATITTLLANGASRRSPTMPPLQPSPNSIKANGRTLHVVALGVNRIGMDHRSDARETKFDLYSRGAG